MASLSFLSTARCGRRGADFSVDVMDGAAGAFVAVGVVAIGGWRAGVELSRGVAGAVDCSIDA